MTEDNKTQATPPAKIVRFVAENIKRLKCVEIEPGSGVVKVTGKNANGKTSLLHAIWLAFEYSVINRQIGRVINDEADHGRIYLEVDGAKPFKLERTFDRKDDGKITTSLMLRTPEGAKYDQPQNLLTSLISELSCYPMKFAEADSKTQLNMYMEAIGKGDELHKIEALKKAVFEDRTNINREIKSLNGQLGGYSFPDDTPDDPVDVAALVSAIDAAKEHNASVSKLDEAMDNALTHRDDVARDLAEAEKQLEELQIAIASHKDDLEAAKKEVERTTDERDAFEPIEYKAEQEKLDNVQTINDAVSQKKQYDKTADLLKAKQAESDAKTSELESLERQKSDVIESAELPIDGLGFDGEVVTYNGRPFCDASEAEKIRVSFALSIALEPVLGIALIHNYSLIDEDGQKIIQELAETHGFQVFAEVVGEGGNGEIWLEDGMVKDADTQDPEETKG